MRALEGKNVLILGATQGIGAAIAVEASAVGAAGVAITGRSLEKVREQAAALEATTVLIEANLADTSASARVIDEAWDALGGIDGLVIAGGTSERAKLTEATEEHLQRVFSTNVFGPFLSIARVIERATHATRPVTIVTVLSMSSHGGQPYLPAYSASKSALATLTKNVANSYRFHGARINGINLGATATPGADALQQGYHGRSPGWEKEDGPKQPQGELIRPSQVATLACFLLSEESAPMNGALIDYAQRIIGTLD